MGTPYDISRVHRHQNEVAIICDLQLNRSTALSVWAPPYCASLHHDDIPVRLHCEVSSRSLNLIHLETQIKVSVGTIKVIRRINTPFCHFCPLSRILWRRNGKKLSKPHLQHKILPQVQRWVGGGLCRWCRYLEKRSWLLTLCKARRGQGNKRWHVCSTT